MASLASDNPMDEVLVTVAAWLKTNLTTEYPMLDTISCLKSSNLALADVTVPLHKYAGQKKMKPDEFAKEIAEKLKQKIQAPDAPTSLVLSVESAAGYLNIMLNKQNVFPQVVQNVLQRGTSYGHLSVKKGKIAYIEHTSSNPNASLHIGNMRSTLIGAHLANLLKAVGYDAKQLFYVNDLGYQIGLTVLGYIRVYHKVQPDRKMDQFIGVIYAIMNTFNELQKLGQDLLDVEEKVKAGYVKASYYTIPEADAAKLEEWVDIYCDIRGRFPELFSKLLEQVSHLNIAVESGKLNLAYEQNDPKTVRIFRQMVMNTLAGVQETLDTYRVRHDRWDFESELGWEGANQRVLEVLKKSPYYVPETQRNEKGVPEGSYLNLAKVIEDAGLPTGKKGYQKDYPPLYVLRPDGSTLYSFRDVVYSFKKCVEADLVLNVICSEQNLAQEKVALSLKLLKPDMERKQFHMSYDLVKLTTGRMSGRRARYLLADDLYEELKDVMHGIIVQKYAGQDISAEFINNVSHEMATCAYKWTMLSTTAHNILNFDINKAVSMEDASGPFVLYNSSRMNSVITKMHERVAAGIYPAFPTPDKVDFSALGSDEWKLFVEYVLGFPLMVSAAAVPEVPPEPQLPEFGIHRTCDFLLSLTQAFSSYYNKNIVLVHPDKAATATPAEFNAMFARVYFVMSVKTVLDNGLRLLMIEPLPKV